MVKRVIIPIALVLMCNAALAQQWRQIFTDTLLQNYIGEALEANSDIRTAQLALQQADALLKAARLSYLPSLALAPSGTVAKAQNASATYTYELPLTMSWELNFGGKRHYQKKMAESIMQREEKQLEYAQIQLVADVADAYCTLLALDRQYAVTQEGVSNQAENLRVLRAMKDVGQQTEAAVNQAEAAYQGVAATLPALEAQIRKAESALCLLLNRQPDTIARAPWNTANGIVLDAEQAYPLESLSARPDVLAAEYGLLAAFNNERVARSEFYPALTISGSAGWTNNIGEIVNPAQMLLNAIGSLTQPLFVQGRLKANRKVAKAQSEQAQIAFEKALLTAGGELRDALADCQACQKRADTRALQVDAARRAYENSREHNRHAATTYLEVLIAQSVWLDAQLQQAADWLATQQSFISLYKATCPQ